MPRIPRTAALATLGVLAAFLSGCACGVDHELDAENADGGPVDAGPEVGICGWDNPPITVGDCWGPSYLVSCLTWVNRRAPDYALVEDLYDIRLDMHRYHRGETNCRGPGYPCVRGDRCFPDGGCACGDRPECGVGEICIRYAADGGFDCVCGQGPP